VLCCSGGLLAAPDARLRRRSQIAAGMLRKSTTLFLLGRPDGAATCGPRGSPFQLPTRLADGLGLRSGLGSGSPLPFAPVRNSTPDLGPPHRPAGRRAKLGCNYFNRFSQSHNSFNCQMRVDNLPATHCDATRSARLTRGSVKSQTAVPTEKGGVATRRSCGCAASAMPGFRAQTAVGRQRKQPWEIVAWIVK